MEKELRTYRTFKKNFLLEPYLVNVTRTSFRVSITRLRVGCHSQEIEVGRYHKPSRNGKWASDVGRWGRGTTGPAVGAARFLLLYAPIKPFANSRQKALNGDGLVVVEVLYWWRMKVLAMETSTENVLVHFPALET